MIIIWSEIARNLLHVRNTDDFGNYVILKRSTVLLIYISHSRVLLALGVWYLTCRSIIAKEFCSCEKYKKIGGPEDTFERKHIVFHV